MKRRAAPLADHPRLYFKASTNPFAACLGTRLSGTEGTWIPAHRPVSSSSEVHGDPACQSCHLQGRQIGTDNSRRLVVDAKRRRRRVTINDVEAFSGLMEDVGATHGYLVCPHGHTKAAERRAQQKVSIRLVPLDCLEGFDPSTWPQCDAPK